MNSANGTAKWTITVSHPSLMWVSVGEAPEPEPDDPEPAPDDEGKGRD